MADTATTKLDQADVVALLQTANGELAAIKATGKTAAVLVSEHGTLTGQVATLTGDKTKLVAGATLPTDLVSAANTILNLTVERDNLKGEKLTVEQAVAKEVAKLGIGGDKAKAANTENKSAKLSRTQLVLKSKGLPLDTKIQIGFGTRGQQVPTGQEINE